MGSLPSSRKLRANEADPADSAWLADTTYQDFLREVARHDLKGRTAPQIATALNVSYEHILIALKRIAQVRIATVETAELFEMRQRSIEHFRMVQEDAWDRLRDVPPTSRVSADLLNQIAAAEREIVRLQGTLAVMKEDNQYDRSVHVQIINGITERLSRIARPGPGADVLALVESTGSAGDQVHLGAVGAAEPTAPTWELVDVDDPGRTRLGETAGPGHQDPNHDWLDHDGPD